MNIAIYYLSKKIIIHQINQTTENQSFKNLDLLQQSEIIDEFIRFTHQNDQTLLTFTTKNIKNAFEKFKKAFKFIEAAGGLIEKDNKWLFIFRLKRWDLPKGKLDAGESPEEAAIRECEEECGITKLTITQTLEPTYHIYEHKGGYALKKTYWYSMKTQHTGTLVPQLEEQIERVEWFNRPQIDEIVLPNSYPAILDVIKNIA